MWNKVKLGKCSIVVSCIHVLIRYEKEGRKKQGQTNNKAKQHSTPKAVTFLRKISCLGWDSNPRHSTL